MKQPAATTGFSVTCHSAPYRGAEGGRLGYYANVPNLPVRGGRLAGYVGSVAYNEYSSSNLPPVSNLPPDLNREARWQVRNGLEFETDFSSTETPRGRSMSAIRWPPGAYRISTECNLENRTRPLIFKSKFSK